MTDKEIKALNYTKGTNNYILLGNSKWVAFQKHIIDKLRTEYNDSFNLVIYWYANDASRIEYVCIPYKAVSHLMTDNHLSNKKDGSLCWTFIIKDNQLMVHANSNYSHDISRYFNVGLIGDNQIGEYDVNYTAEEGRIKYFEHKRIERDSKIANLVKAVRFKKDPKLHCDVCGFSFIDKYGDIGKFYIEAHHIIPLSELPSVTTTSVSDFALVCANCHRMLHSRVPALTINELKTILNKS
jgi:hypothetical protein